jgi:hypothetical protein
MTSGAQQSVIDCPLFPHDLTSIRYRALFRKKPLRYLGIGIQSA